MQTDLCGSLILDIGGRKHSLIRFLPLNEPGKIIVLNRDRDDLLGPARKNILAVRGDGVSLPFADNTFDVVTSITTLEHVDKNDRFKHLEEMRRVSKGKILIYLPIGPEGEKYERKLYKWSLSSHIKFMTKQHIDNGLPTLNEFKKGLSGCTITPIQNANVWLVCMILSQIPFLGIFLPSFFYAVLQHIKIEPYYEYLIEYDKKNEGKSKTILIVSKCLPRFDMGSGHVRMFAIIKLLLKHYKVLFIAESFIQSADIDDMRYAEELNSLGVCVYAEKFRLKEIKKMDFNLVLFSWYATAVRRLPIIRRNFPKIPIIIDSVDVHFVREMQMAEVYQDKALMKKALRTKQDELAVYREADQVWTVTVADKQILQENEPNLDVHIIPNIHEFVPVNRSNIEPNTLLFIGNFLHDPNEDAIIYFCNHIFPMIQQKKPKAILYIVGNAPTEKVKALKGNSIKVTGWVPDTRPYLEKCHVAIVPLRFGAGLKGKVGEAMMAGIPIVTTPVGIQGMDVKDGTHLLVRTKDEEFAEGVITLLNDNDLSSSLSVNGINYIKQRFTPEVVEKEIRFSLEKLLK